MEGNVVISKLDDEFLWSIIVINSTLIFISEWKEVLKYHYTRQTLPASPGPIYGEQYGDNVCPAGISSVLERCGQCLGSPCSSSAHNISVRLCKEWKCRDRPLCELELSGNWTLHIPPYTGLR